MLNYYKDKTVFITGHTGFKGAWLCRILIKAGARVVGYALSPPTTPNLYSVASIESNITSIIGDIRDLASLKAAFKDASPDFAIHMAAQPIVKESYKDPHYTYDVNVMGTVNFLECIRESPTVKSVLVVTTDKVYQNNEWEWGYRENDILNGYDPYSNSKSCAELVLDSYRKSFFQNSNVRLSSARAGNVIGGGDFAQARVIPDCIRFATADSEIIIRNPYSTRPYQHVLEPLSAYLSILESQHLDSSLSGSYNVGPRDFDCVSTGTLASIFCSKWGNGVKWINASDNGPHEANFLKLDCSKIENRLKWKPKWSLEYAVEKTVELTKAYQAGHGTEVLDSQITEYFGQ